MACVPLRVGESIIPLFISIPLKRSGGDEPIRPLRWIDTQNLAIQKRFRDLAFYIENAAAYNVPTAVPYRTKGKHGYRTLPEGFKPLQVLVQPERGLYRESGTFIPNEDALCFYDMDALPLNRQVEAYERLKHLMDEGRAFVWMNAIVRPKAAFWVRTDESRETAQTMLQQVHQEVFQGDPDFAPALGPSDMWKSFVHSAEVLEGMRAFFAGAYQTHVQTIHDAVMARYRRQEEQRKRELTERWGPSEREVDQPIATQAEDPNLVIPADPEPVATGIEKYLRDQGLWDLEGPFPDAFDAFLQREFAPRLDHSLKYPLYEEALPQNLFGRKASRLQELVLRLALSMPGALLGEGVGLPSTLVQKLAHQFYPEDFQLSFDASGKLDASGASKAIRQLVRRGVLEVTDHAFRPGAMSKRYRAVHPDLIDLAKQRNPGKRFAERTVEDVDHRWKELTGSHLAETSIDGVRDQVLYRLTNVCPSYEVFEAAALRIPGMASRPDRLRFLPSQWEAHLERDQKKGQVSLPEAAEMAIEPEPE